MGSPKRSILHSFYSTRVELASKPNRCRPEGNGDRRRTQPETAVPGNPKGRTQTRNGVESTPTEHTHNRQGRCKGMVVGKTKCEVETCRSQSSKKLPDQKDWKTCQAKCGILKRKSSCHASQEILKRKTKARHAGRAGRGGQTPWFKTVSVCTPTVRIRSCSIPNTDKEKISIIQTRISKCISRKWVPRKDQSFTPFIQHESNWRVNQIGADPKATGIDDGHSPKQRSRAIRKVEPKPETGSKAHRQRNRFTTRQGKTPKKGRRKKSGNPMHGLPGPNERHSFQSPARSGSDYASCSR